MEAVDTNDDKGDLPDAAGWVGTTNTGIRGGGQRGKNFDGDDDGHALRMTLLTAGEGGGY
jgi:hypothetical protein